MSTPPGIGTILSTNLSNTHHAVPLMPAEIAEPTAMKFIRFYSDSPSELKLKFLNEPAEELALQLNTPFTFWGKSARGNLITPLMWACLESNVPLVRVLLEHGADPNYMITPFSTARVNSYYLVASLSSHAATSLMETLLEFTAPVVLHSDGDDYMSLLLYTLLSTSGRSDPHEMLQVLFNSPRSAEIMRGIIDMPSPTDAAPAALSICLYYRYSASFNLLLKAGANPNVLDKKGRSALHIAVINDLPAETVALLAAGADPTIKTAKGKTMEKYFKSPSMRYLFDQQVQLTRDVKKPAVVKYEKPAVPANMDKHKADTAPPTTTPATDATLEEFLQKLRSLAEEKAVGVSTKAAAPYPPNDSTPVKDERDRAVRE